MLTLPAYFTGFSSRSDGSAGLRFTTNELTPQDFATLKEIHNAFGWLLFKPNEHAITAEEIPTDDVEEEGISSSERLRRVMYVYWKQKEISAEFEVWRRQQMEILIDKFKAKLEPR